MRISRGGWLGLLAAMAMAGPAAGQVVYVSTSGSDDAAGTPDAPLATLTRALERNARDIRMEQGNYILSSATTTIPSNVVVRGGYFRTTGPGGESVWEQDHRPTVLLKTELPLTPAFVLAAAINPADQGGAMERVTILGGYASVEMRAAARLSDVTLGGATVATILVQQGNGTRPALIDRVTITGGGGIGIQVAGTGSATITNTVVRGTLSRGIDITGTGTVLVDGCVVQGSGADGISVIGNSNVRVQSSHVLRNAGSGLVARQCNVVVAGNVFERNESGIRMLQCPAAMVLHNTIVDQRAAGIFLERSTPTVAHNILAHNGAYGVWEETNPGDPVVGGLLQGNFFHANALGEYLDEGQNVYTLEGALNSALVNTITPEGNRVADPLFAARDRFDYRLVATSPAIDRAPAPAGLARDAEGNPRAVDMDAESGTANQIADAGALEFQPTVLTHFGALSRLESVTETTGKRILTAPQWVWNETSPFQPIAVEMLPGRLRMWSPMFGAFGAVARRETLQQRNNEVLILRADMTAPNTTGARQQRMRINGNAPQDITFAYVIEGSKSLPPTPEGRRYEMFFDLRQGGYTTIPLPDRPTAPYNLFLDMVDFGESPYRQLVDVTRLEVDAVDRDLFDLQFGTPVVEWGFDGGVESWTPRTIPAAFREPLLRWSAARTALELVQPFDGSGIDNYFGAWASPFFSAPAGTLLRVEARISTNQPLETTPQFRFRLSAEDFSFTQEMTVLSLFNTPAAPAGDGSVYTLYARVPSGLPDGTRLVFFWDLFGFGDANRRGSLYLENLSITRTQ